MLTVGVILSLAGAVTVGTLDREPTHQMAAEPLTAAAEPVWRHPTIPTTSTTSTTTTTTVPVSRPAPPPGISRIGPPTSVRARPAPVPTGPPARMPAASGWSGPWACIAHYESGGNPATDTGNGYYGGLQFSMSTWHAYGGTGNPAAASIAAQEAVAARVLASQGWRAWPNTSRLCGY